ncbi:MAG: tetratricopeptide repeat protein [Polyangiaceae bacterium]|nr:tetratricopeptide repeat protein [Polyangiaceae bacterium]
MSTHAMAEPTAAERSLATALFDQGRALMAEGKIDEACIKLAESQRMDPGGGTLLNLALCHERQGKIATAWTEFREARAIAKKDGRADREAAADAAIQKLEPLLSRVSVVVPVESKIAGLTVEIDGSPVPEAGWGTAFPIDPGTHAVTMKAPGYRVSKSSFDIGKDPISTTVNVPKLEKESGPTLPVAGPASSIAVSAGKPPRGGAGPDASSSSIRTVGFVVGGVGLALVGVSAVTGGLAIKNDSTADENCDGNVCADPADVELSRQALTLSYASTATFGLGMAGVLVGAVVIAVAPKNTAGKVSLSVGPGSISVAGRF